MLIQFRNMFYLLWRVPLIRPVLRRIEYPLKLIVFFCFQHGLRKHWETRLNDVRLCPDNAFIPRVVDAGSITAGCLVMHNGIKIVKGSYYGIGNLLLLQGNRGVHEPQEERMFMEVLKYMPENALMIELGAYWGFYSMWFQKEVKNPSCFLVEPEPRGLEFGRMNFAKAGIKGKFIQASAGAASGMTEEGVPVICVDDLIVQHNIDHIHILHSDIQGAELDMLLGSAQAFRSDRVDYIFISTHTDELHRNCLSFLRDYNFLILAEAELDESYSVDGLIVARRGNLKGLEPVTISKKTAATISR